MNRAIKRSLPRRRKLFRGTLGGLSEEDTVGGHRHKWNLARLCFTVRDYLFLCSLAVNVRDSILGLRSAPLPVLPRVTFGASGMGLESPVASVPFHSSSVIFRRRASHLRRGRAHLCQQRF